MSLFLLQIADEFSLTKGTQKNEKSLRNLQEFGDQSKIDDYQFDWEITDLQQSYMKIQVEFKNINVISSTPYGYDSLLIRVDD